MTTQKNNQTKSELMMAFAKKHNLKITELPSVNCENASAIGRITVETP